jgi:hypothetical protein
MQKIKKIDSACVGYIVQFVYNRGSDPGNTRTVLVDRENNNMVEGYDFMRQQFRKFYTSSMSDLHVLENGDGIHRISTTSLPTSVGVDVMRRGYEADGFLTYDKLDVLYAVKESVVAQPKPIPSMEFNSNGALCISGPGGDMAIFPSHRHGMKINLACGSTCHFSTPQDLLNELKVVLG